MPPKAPPARMSLDEVMHALAANGTAQNIKIYRRHGGIDPMFGVSSAFLKELAKKIKRDHDLAADRWLTSVRCYAAAGYLSTILGASPVGLSRTKAWISDPTEYTRTTGYDTLTAMLRLGVALDAAWLSEVVARIEAEIGGSANRARHAMNMALIAIGGYREELRESVLAAAARIGPVKVDHGETSCVTPEVAPYIARMVARQKG